MLGWNENHAYAFVLMMPHGTSLKNHVIHDNKYLLE